MSLATSWPTFETTQQGGAEEDDAEHEQGGQVRGPLRPRADHRVERAPGGGRRLRGELHDGALHRAKHGLRYSICRLFSREKSQLPGR